MPFVAFAQRKNKEESDKKRDGGPGRALLFEINRTKDPATASRQPGHLVDC